MKRLLLCFVVLCSVFLLAGCGSVNKDMVGTYKGIEMTEGDTTYDEKTLDTLGVSFTLEVKDDGTAILDLAGDKTKLKYDSKYFSDSESKSKYTFKDGVLTISSEDASMVFKKN